ncbi:OTU domain-containing protein 3, partial [Tremellales sp. Uapishka_1]
MGYSSSSDEPIAGPSNYRTRLKRPRVVLSESEDDTPPPILMRGGGKPPRSLPSAARPKRTRPLPARTTRTTRSSARRDSFQLDTSLEAITEEAFQVKKEIARLGLALRDVTGDGNCLFRALADQLWGDMKRHVEIRKLVCDYLEMNQATMEGFVVPFLGDREDYGGYVKRMRESKQFGSHIEIQAAARVFKRNVRVVMSSVSLGVDISEPSLRLQSSFTIIWQDESSTRSSTPPPTINTPPATPRPRPRTRSSTINLLTTPAGPDPSYTTALATYLPPVPEGRSMLWLALFSQAEHFESIRHKGDKESGPAEIEDRLAVPHASDRSEAAKKERGEMLDTDSAVPLRGDLIQQVLASLPPNHGISASEAAGVLARVKGNLGDAVEILLEEVVAEDNDTESDIHVEALLPASSATSSTDTLVYRESSPTSSSSDSPGETVVSSSGEGEKKDKGEVEIDLEKLRLPVGDPKGDGRKGRRLRSRL